MRVRPAIALLLCAVGSSAKEDQRWVEITATVSQVGPGQGAAAVLGAPRTTCPIGQECKLFVGRESTDGEVDHDAIRIEVTPTLMDDGRIQLKVVSLGTELGEQPGEAPAKPRPRVVFHSVLPAEGLYSLADASGSRRWMRLGQEIDGWKLSAYEAPTRTLLLARGSQTLRLNLASASIGSPADASGRRTETLALVPGGEAQILGKDGRQVTLGVRFINPDQPR